MTRDFEEHEILFALCFARNKVFAFVSTSVLPFVFVYVFIYLETFTRLTARMFLSI